jgi:hypothetical protein
MARPDTTFCALLALALASASCVPKATIVAQPPVVKNEEKKEKEVVLEPISPEPPVPGLPDDGGIRMPGNFTDLPSDDDFRKSAAGAPKSDSGSGAVISRPPTDPPSRVKPKPAEQE